MTQRPTPRRLSTRLIETAVAGDVVDTRGAPILALARGVAYAALFVAAIWIAGGVLAVVALDASAGGGRPEGFIAMLRQAPA
jgi:hypothetical protein